MEFDDYLALPLPFEKITDKLFKDSDKLIIFEVGACEGEDTIKLRRKYPSAKIFAFEPLPKNVRRMKKNYKKYHTSDIRIEKLAMSNRDGSAEFYVSSGHPKDIPKSKTWDYGNKSSSLLAPKEHTRIHNWIKFKKRIKVKTQRLDTFCAERSIDKIDLMFLDVQGAELMVLEGAGGLLNNVRAVWMEVEAIELYDKQPLKNDVERFMKRHGFDRLVDTVDAVSGDQFYVRKK